MHGRGPLPLLQGLDDVGEALGQFDLVRHRHRPAAVLEVGVVETQVLARVGAVNELQHDAHGSPLLASSLLIRSTSTPASCWRCSRCSSIQACSAGVHSLITSSALIPLAPAPS